MRKFIDNNKTTLISLAVILAVFCVSAFLTAFSTSFPRQVSCTSEKLLSLRVISRGFEHDRFPFFL